MQVWCGNLQPRVPNTNNGLYSQVWEILCPTVIAGQIADTSLGQWRRCVFISIVELRMLLNPARWWNSVVTEDSSVSWVKQLEAAAGATEGNSSDYSRELMSNYCLTETLRGHMLHHRMPIRQTSPSPNCIFLEFLMRQKHWVPFKEFNWVIIMSDKL